MIVGVLTSIRRFPVKSLAGESLECVEVGDLGIPGDRDSAFFVRSEHARRGKTYRGKEDDRLHLVADPAGVPELVAARGVELERRSGGGFFDAAPISLLVDRWLEALNAYVGYPVEPVRFRPNFVVRADAAFHSSEADLCGLELAVGTVRLRVRAPIERCVVTTYDPAGGKNDPEILRFVARQRNALMGIYCDVVTPGKVRVGDAVSIVT